RVLVAQAVGQDLDEEEQIGGGARLGKLRDDPSVRAVRILAIRPHVDEQLRGGAAELPDVGRAEQDLGNAQPVDRVRATPLGRDQDPRVDRKSTRLNSSHVAISYAVFCLKKK